MCQNEISISTITPSGTLNIVVYKDAIYINDKLISYPRKIINFSISSDKVFLVWIDPSDEPIDYINNNVEAYNFEGELLWNIYDIIGKAWPFGNVNVYDAETIIEQVEFVNPNMIIKNHEYLVCYNVYERRYIIDITQNKLIQEKGGFK